ncbi:hypothetical protein RI129_001031 [Pyrocoelia pectoralis]|uniref:protein disulfide-isomerase n=1 Tax=Pyrocoelia pectoralis TaxID=417401 RepID=A0AAN7ZPE1_9COLE
MWRLLVMHVLISSSCALYPHNSNVIELTGTNFDRLVVYSDDLWIAEFFVPWCGYCQRLVPDYQKAANALKGFVNVGALNVEKHRGVGTKYDIEGFPTIKLFGVNKKKPKTFNGQRTAQGLIDAGLTAIRRKIKANFGEKLNEKSTELFSGKNVVKLTNKNFDKLVINSTSMWLVAFYVPWCSHCKNLSPEWIRAASTLKGQFKFGALDATVYTKKADQYKIRAYPTAKYFTAGNKTELYGKDYDGGRTSDDIVTWALEKIAENLPAPEIRQILNEVHFKESCEQNLLCVISVLPHILECQSDCRNEYLNVLKRVSEMHKKRMWGWVWSQAGDQRGLEEALGLVGFGYPTLVIINVKRMVYTLFKGSFDVNGIHNFLRDIIYGRERSSFLMTSEPKIVPIEAWDGKDFEFPQEEYYLYLLDVDVDVKDEL